jgi:hypothetical protein
VRLKRERDRETEEIGREGESEIGRGSRRWSRTLNLGDPILYRRWLEPKFSEAWRGLASCETKGGRSSMGHQRRNFPAVLVAILANP